MSSHFFQVHEWMDEEECKDPKDWGWVEVQNQLRPLMTDLPAAPQALLKVVRCNCKTDCNTMTCICKKHGLECSMVCADCKGLNCINSRATPIADPDEDA